DEAQQQVLRADVVVVELSCLFVGEVDHPLGARGELHILAQIAVAARDLSFDIGTDPSERDTQAVQYPGGDAIVFPNQPQEQVFGPDRVLAQPRCFFLCEEDHAARSFGEPLPHDSLTLLATGCQLQTPTVRTPRRPPHDRQSNGTVTLARRVPSTPCVFARNDLDARKLHPASSTPSASACSAAGPGACDWPRLLYRFGKHSRPRQRGRSGHLYGKGSLQLLRHLDVRHQFAPVAAAG